MASLKVAVRVRPFNQREIEMGAEMIVEMDGKKTRLFKPKTGMTRDNLNEFTFDYSYSSVDPAEKHYITQEQVYEDLGTDVINCAFQGYNACVFAYGQTGSGKTFTMMGTADMQGLIPRICKALFGRMHLGENEGIGYKTHVSYLEIYNEKVKDLLATENLGHSLKVREHRVLGPYVEDLSQHPVSDYTEIQKCITRGNNLRTTASTKMNDTSSRSHAIFTITFVQADFRNDLPSETVSKIHLVDLAGSERATATGATGQRLKEGAHINKSLVTLGSVISALADQTVTTSSKKLSYIPYRDSVLTWLLKDSLGGNSKTIMIAAISPADCNYGETLSTLRYANRAKNIINKPTINEDPNVKLIRELRDEINKLKSMLVNEPNKMHPSPKVLEDLHNKEAQEKSLTEAWAEKWRKAQKILREEKSLYLSKSGFGVVLDSEMPHLIRIHDDTSTGVTLYSLKEGTTTIGNEDAENPQDIVLDGIYPEHCTIVLENGIATLYPKSYAQCWLNTVLIEEPVKISQGDLLVIGRTNMFKYNNPAEAAKLKKDPSRSCLNLSQYRIIAASRENLLDDDLPFTSPFKHRRNYKSTEILTSQEEIVEIENETNKKLLETIENALVQLKYERLKMHEHYKKKVLKLKDELMHLERTQQNRMIILDCKERELMARREMLIWERDNEKIQVDIIFKQLSTIQNDLEIKKQSFNDFVMNELLKLQEIGKFDESDIKLNESTPIEESSEILLHISNSLDNYKAQFIKDTIKRNRNEIYQTELIMNEKKEALDESSNKLCDLDNEITNLEKETANLKLEKSQIELKKKSMNLDLKSSDEYYKDNIDTFHTANSDCSENSQIGFSQLEPNMNSTRNHHDDKIMVDSGVCLDGQMKLHTSPLNESSAKSTDDDESSCISSCETPLKIPSYSECSMNKLKEKISMQKAKILKNYENDSNKTELNHQIEYLNDLQKEYLKMELDCLGPLNKQRNNNYFSDTDANSENYNYNMREGSLADTDYSMNTRSNYSRSVFNISHLARSLPSIGPYQESEHTITIPGFIIRGAGKQTHYEYEIRINLPDGRWTLLRRFSRFRDLHISMKNCYGHKVSQIPFPRREIFSTNSESVARVRRRQLESYLRHLLLVCSKIPQSPIYEGNDSIGLTKTTLIQLSPFFQKGLFESGKHGTG